MRVLALSDLHLSFVRDKPMDIFSEIWKDHPQKIDSNWRRVVRDDDVVLLGGDLSWAMNLSEMEEEFKYLESLPGRKVLIRGNHDYWWGSDAKVRRSVPPSCEILNGHATEILEGIGVAGTRLWTSEEDEGATEDDVKIYRRELARLERSLIALETLKTQRRIAMVHYPPTGIEAESEAETLLRKHRVDTVIYGHLHGEEDHQSAIHGKVRGIDYHLTSADFLEFTPIVILDEESTRRAANVGGS